MFIEDPILIQVSLYVDTVKLQCLIHMYSVWIKCHWLQFDEWIVVVNYSILLCLMGGITMCNMFCLNGEWLSYMVYVHCCRRLRRSEMTMDILMFFKLY